MVVGCGLFMCRGILDAKLMSFFRKRQPTRHLRLRHLATLTPLTSFQYFCLGLTIKRIGLHQNRMPAKAAEDYGCTTIIYLFCQSTAIVMSRHCDYITKALRLQCNRNASTIRPACGCHAEPRRL